MTGKRPDADASYFSPLRNGGMTDQSEIQARLRITCQGDLWSIRSLLADAEVFLKEQSFPADRIDDLKLVLAEAMTNIARHGYSDRPGEISLSLVVEDRGVLCELVDTGVAFDPSGLGYSSPEPAQAREGGYGWFIIRAMSQSVCYVREQGRNKLCFRFPRGSAA